jgi:hypothetical protein
MCYNIQMLETAHIIDNSRDLEPIDAEIFEKYSAARTELEIGTDYSDIKLSDDELVQKAAEFAESDCAVNPDLRPNKISEDTLVARELALKELKKDILASDMPDFARQAYRWSINEAIASTHMTRAAHEGNMRAFNRYNRYIYGDVNPESFAVAVGSFEAFAKVFVDSDNEAISEAAKQVLGLLPDTDVDVTDRRDEAFDGIKAGHIEFYDTLMEGIEKPENGSVPYAEMEPLVQQMLINIGATDYVAAKRTSGVGFSVDHANKQVLYPKSTGKMPWKRFVGLGGGHEVKTHVLEYVRGIESRLQLISTGLDRYEQASEGKGVIRETVPYDSLAEFEKLLRNQDVLRRQFAVALATGADGEPRDFVETFKIINAVDRLWERVKKPGDIEAADKKAFKRSFDLLSQKTFVGSDGSAGSVYRKNMLYLDGWLAYSALSLDHPELSENWDDGKIDLTNPRHIWIMQEAGLLQE